MSEWDIRYQGEEYAFGTEPNLFIKEILPLLPKGRALGLAEGEGRNGVFLAEHGFCFEGVDVSAVGLAKAQQLARKKGVQIQTHLADITTWKIEAQSYAVITSVFCHLREPARSHTMQNIVQGLQKGGMFVGVFYHPDQIQYGTGGPKDSTMLADISTLQAASSGLQWKIARHQVHHLEEGSRHSGMSSVIYLLGEK